MTSYVEMAHERKKARPLYLVLRALDPEPHVKEDLRDRSGYRVTGTGQRSLPEAHADRLRRRVEEGKLEFLRVLWVLWDADLEAIRREGGEA